MSRFISRVEALTLCSEFERQLAGEWHVALTGSCLYGAAESFKDIDVVIYPHGESKATEADRLAVMNRLGIDAKLLVETGDREYDGIRTIYKGIHAESGATVDAFFLR